MSEWHLRKEVTIGNIFAAGAALAAVMAAWYNLDTRVNMLEVHQADINQHMLHEERARKADVERVCDRLERIENIMLQVLRDEARDKK